MADPWNQFPDAPAAPAASAAGDPWAQFPDVQKSATQGTHTGMEHFRDTIGVFARHPLTATVGLAENALGSVTGGFGSLAEAVTGKDPGTIDLAYRPRTQAGQEIAQLGAEESAKVGQQYDKLAGTGPLAQTLKERIPQAGAAVSTVTGIAGGRGAFGRVPGNVGPRVTPGVTAPAAGEAGAAAEAAAAARSTRLAPVSAESPPKAQLKAAAKAAYKRSEEAGAVATEESFAATQKAVADELGKQGLDPTLHPRTTAALKRFSEEKGPVSLEKLETLRRIAKDAESGTDAADTRLAGELVDHIDSYVENLGTKDFAAGGPEAAQALKQARNYWSRARKADTLDELVRRAELSAPNFSGSGMENALRTEFRALAKNERRMRLFTAEERAAIERVAKGAPVENALRMLGKFAPTGIVSAILSGGAGAAAGGPLGALALPAMGTAARAAATRMTMNNVGRANALVRRGPPITQAVPPRPVPNALAPGIGLTDADIRAAVQPRPANALARANAAYAAQLLEENRGMR